MTIFNNECGGVDGIGGNGGGGGPGGCRNAGRRCGLSVRGRILCDGGGRYTFHGGGGNGGRHSVRNVTFYVIRAC